MPGKVLLPLDGSEASIKAFIPARSIAELLGMTLCILHVCKDELTKQELLDKLCLKPEDIGCFVIDQVSGAPVKSILEASKNSNYVVMGTHGETCDKTLRMGSITAEVVEKVDKPILLIKPDACLNLRENKWEPHKALIPLNGAPGSAQALEPAMEVLSKTSAKIELVHILADKCQPIKEEGGFTAPYYEDYPQHEWPSWSKEFLKRFCPTMSNHIKTSVSLVKGDPADEIMELAEKHSNDFIAIAWHGVLSQFRALTLKRILAESNCPIMLIRIKD